MSDITSPLAGGQHTGAHEQRRDRPDPGETQRRALRLGVALGVSAALCAALGTHVGRRLSVRTTIVGYPTYADFDVNRYQDLFYLAAVVFPVLTLALYQLASWRGPLRRRSPARHRRPGLRDEDRTAGPDALESRSWISALGRVAIVGAVIAIEASAALLPSRPAPEDVALGAGAYALVVVGLASALARRHGQLTGWVARLNGFGALVPLPGLAAVSGITGVTVAGKGTVAYPWFPIWLAVLLGGVELAVLAVARRRFRVPVARLEGRLVIYVVGSLAVFLVLAGIPSQLGPMDTFTEGEYLAGAYLIAHGAMPWRDLYMIHGLLDDGLKAMVGFTVFGTSRWGATAGITMFVTPAYFVAMYLFVAYTFARRWAMVAAFAVAITCGIFVDWDPRYLCWPLVLCAFVAVLRKASPARAAVLALALLGQAILVPEMSLAILALGATLVLYELYERPRGRLAAGQLRASLCCAGTGLGAFALFAGYLAVTHALSGFIGYYQDFATSHSLTGGIPLWTNYAVAPVPDHLGISRFSTAYGGPFSRYSVELYLPTLCVLATALLVAARVRGGRRLAAEDWVAVASSLFVLLYEQKALSRADNAHIAEVFAASTPLVMVLVYRGASLLQDLAGRALQRASARSGALARGVRTSGAFTPGSSGAVGLVALVLALLVAPNSALARLGDAPAHFRASSPNPPAAPYRPGLPSLGYATAGAVPAGLVDDLGALFARYDPGDGPVFDFSDAPGVVEFLLGRRQGSRFYDISLAITPQAQALVVDDLRHSRPRLVLWNGITGLPSWDFIQNEVRQYVVARYVLAHYRPLALVDHELVLISDSSTAAALHSRTFPDLYFSEFACAWGYTPNFLENPPLASPQRVALTRVGPIPGGTLYQLQLPPDASTRDGYIEVTRASGSSDGSITLTDPVAHGRRNVQRHDITWVDRAGTLRTEVEVGSCLQWHGYGSTLDLRYSGPGSIGSVTLGS